MELTLEIEILSIEAHKYNSPIVGDYYDVSADFVIGAQMFTAEGSIEPHPDKEEAFTGGCNVIGFDSAKLRITVFSRIVELIHTQLCRGADTIYVQ